MGGGRVIRHLPFHYSCFAGDYSREARNRAINPISWYSRPSARQPNANSRSITRARARGSPCISGEEGNGNGPTGGERYAHVGRGGNREVLMFLTPSRDFQRDGNQDRTVG